MELIRARRVTVQICILYKPENSVILLSANLGLERRWIRRKTKSYLLHRALRTQIFQEKPLGLERRWFRRKTKDYVFTQSSTNADISAEIEGNVVSRLDISLSALILYRLLKAAFPFSFF